MADMIKKATKGWLVLSRVKAAKGATSTWQDEVEERCDLRKSNGSGSGSNTESNDEKSSQWLSWADRKHSIGFIVRVVDGKDAPSFLQTRLGEDDPAAAPYMIQYDGEL
jgi:hypothetical protein